MSLVDSISCDMEPMDTVGWVYMMWFHMKDFNTYVHIWLTWPFICGKAFISFVKYIVFVYWVLGFVYIYFSHTIFVRYYSFSHISSSSLWNVFLLHYFYFEIEVGCRKVLNLMTFFAHDIIWFFPILDIIMIKYTKYKIYKY